MYLRKIIKKTLDDSLIFWIGYGFVFFLLSIPKQPFFNKILHVITAGIAIKHTIRLLNLRKKTPIIYVFFCFIFYLLICSINTIQNSLTIPPATIPNTHTVKKSFYLTIRNIEISKYNQSYCWRISGWAKENFISGPRYPIQLVSKNTDIWKDNYSGLWKISGIFSKTLSNRIKANKIEKAISLPKKSIYPIEIILSKWAKFRAQAKYYLNSRIQKYCKNHTTASFIQMILLGSSNHREIKTLFALSGISHLLVISGLHFQCIVQLITWICRIFPYKPIRISFEFIGYTGYFLLLGPTPPATRAYCSTVAKTISKILKRKFHPFDELGACLLISGSLDPCTIPSLSYQFSYLATATLFCITKYISTDSSNRTNLLSTIQKKLTVSLSIFITLLPLQISIFGNIPLLSIFLGLIFGELISFFIYLSTISLLSDKFLPEIFTSKFFAFLSICAHILIECLWRCEVYRWQIHLNSDIGYCVLLIAKCLLIWITY